MLFVRMATHGTPSRRGTTKKKTVRNAARASLTGWGVAEKPGPQPSAPTAMRRVMNPAGTALHRSARKARPYRPSMNASAGLAARRCRTLPPLKISASRPSRRSSSIRGAARFFTSRRHSAAIRMAASRNSRSAAFLRITRSRGMIGKLGDDGSPLWSKRSRMPTWPAMRRGSELSEAPRQPRTRGAATRESPCQ